MPNHTIPSWIALGNMPMEEKMAIMESYHMDHKLLESQSHIVEYFQNLDRFASAPEKNKHYIVTPLLLIQNRVISLNTNLIEAKYLGRRGTRWVFEHHGQQVESPNNQTSKQGMHHTFIFDSVDSYDRFRAELAIKFDLNLPSAGHAITEQEKKGLYYNVNKRKKAGTSRPQGHPLAPSDQDWKDAARTAKTEGVAEGSLSEIGYADALDDKSYSLNSLLKISKVDGSIEGNDVMIVDIRNQTVYILIVDNQVTAFVGFENKNLKNIKNFTNTPGVIRALIGYLVHKKNISINIPANEPLTPDGFRWLTTLIKQPRGLVIKDHNGNGINVAKLTKEWNHAKKTGMTGPTGITISESLQFGKNIRDNEARRNSGSLLMPFNFYSVGNVKQELAEGSSSGMKRLGMDLHDLSDSDFFEKYKKTKGQMQSSLEPMYVVKDPGSFNDDDFYAFDPNTKILQSTWSPKSVGRWVSEAEAQRNGWQIVRGLRAKSLGLKVKRRLQSMLEAEVTQDPTTGKYSVSGAKDWTPIKPSAANIPGALWDMAKQAMGVKKRYSTASVQADPRIKPQVKMHDTHDWVIVDDQGNYVASYRRGTNAHGELNQAAALVKPNYATSLGLPLPSNLQAQHGAGNYVAMPGSVANMRGIHESRNTGNDTKFILYVGAEPIAKYDTPEQAKLAAQKLVDRIDGITVDIRQERCDTELLTRITENLKSMVR